MDIKNKYYIDLNIKDEDKTPLSARKTSKFQEYFSTIWKEIDFNEST